MADPGELVAHCIQSGGAGICARLDGAFLLVIWDRRTRTATVSAGGVGQRTIFYRRWNGGWQFASSIATLVGVGGGVVALNRDAVFSMLAAGGLYSQETAIEGVWRLLPGCTARACGDTLDLDEPRPYTAAPFRGLNTREYAAELDHLLRRSARQLQAFGACSVMLSGGVDSALAAAYAKPLLEGSVAGTLVLSPKSDESGAAAEAARALALRHVVHRPELTPVTIVEQLRQYVRDMEEPYWFSLGILLDGLVDLLKPSGPTVLTGMWGDTLFGDRYFHPGGEKTHKSIWGFVPRPINQSNVQGLLFLDGPDPERQIDFLRRSDIGVGIAGYLYGTCVTDGWKTVRMTARIAERHGLEVASPFFNRDVIAAAAGVPDELRSAGADGKPLLRDLWKNRLFPGLPPPQGKISFGADVIKFLRGRKQLEPFIEIAANPRTSGRGFYRPGSLARFLQGFRDGTASNSDNHLLWQIVLLELFCQEFIDGAIRFPGTA
jgi:asparagine synthetase B (glutamine-hydrolysing)